MKVLAIGNSFSEDATKYLHQIAKADNYEIKVVNLYIGGCSLRQHYLNMLDDNKNYNMMLNGDVSGFFVSIREALISDEWDYITFQQASLLSCDYSTYKPYLVALSDYAKKYCPTAKQLLHQTWAYEKNSECLCTKMKYETPQQMFDDIKKSYEKAAAKISADGIIPCGLAFQNLLKNDAKKIHRDPIHASLGIGRYTLALTWYLFLTDNDIENNTFCDFDEEITPEEIQIAKKSATEAVHNIFHSL